MLDESELRSLLSHDVVDGNGKTVGNLELIFNDRETARPEWLGVFTGAFRHHHRLVPVEGAARDGHTVRVPWTKEQIDSAPDYGTATQIPEEMEREAYAHYGLVKAAV
jgi:sporulation protein YlmC with PRC-barrel domain